MAAGFENVQEALDIGVKIRLGVLKRVSDPSLRGQVDDAIKFVFVKERRYCQAVSDVELDEAKAVAAVQVVQARGFQSHIVIIIEIVDADDLVAPVEQSFRRVKTDKASGPCYQDFHARIIGPPSSER